MAKRHVAFAPAGHVAPGEAVVLRSYSSKGRTACQLAYHDTSAQRLKQLTDVDEILANLDQ
jgi:hypothetical protein